MFNDIRERVWRGVKDWWNGRRLRRLLRRLGLERHLEEWNIAHVPFQFPDTRQNVVIVLDQDELQVDGVSGLVFECGKVPKALPYAFARRNGQLTGLRWSLSQAAGSEWFCVGIRLRFVDVSLAMLRGRISAIVEELERCRVAFRYVEKQFGVRRSAWRG